MTSQITGVSIVHLTVCSGADQRKHQSPYHWPRHRGVSHTKASNVEMFAFDNVIMKARVVCIFIGMYHTKLHIITEI